MGEPVLFCSQFGCGLESVVAASIDADLRSRLTYRICARRAYRKQNGGPTDCSLDLFLNTVGTRETICSFYAGAPISTRRAFERKPFP
jgi:hypothetical protein